MAWSNSPPAKSSADAKSDPPRRPTIALPGERQVFLGERLGRGNASVVLSGVLESAQGIRRRVAVKVIDAVAHDEQEQVLPDILEALQQSAQVNHPNVATIYEVTMEGHAPVVLSELIEGRTLEAFIDAYARVGRKIPPDLALFIVTEIAEGLAGARDARTLEGALLNLIHGEPSARDVLISWNGEVKITDFGLAQATRIASGVRNIRSFARRAATLSPEVAKGRRPDARSDVFAVGMILREMLVGPRWPESINDQDAFARVRAGDMDMDVLAPRLYEPIAAILTRALEVEPANRFPHAGALAFELRRASLPLGVGDNRIFLQHAMRDIFTSDDDTEIEPDKTAPARHSRR
ncbi:protein kinase [Pendulispora rubella]|uniref:Protein kinase n=1 Tax=Pendulispora rubella TaxID=2741070 RepID=A0ABZ2L6I1_9BACT